MSGVRNYMLFISDDHERANTFARQAAQDLQAKKSTLIEEVQSLGPYINDDDEIVRSRAVKYLSEVVGNLSPTFLSRQQTEVICQFLCDRIQDGGAVLGLSKLQGYDKFNAAMATMTFRALVENFQDLQLQPQSIRLQILQLLNDLMSHHRNAIKDLGSESLVGITDLVSGEKDPRNLMIIFSILRVLMLEWDISGHAEVLFDSVFCYFPITFRPPPNDPYGITAQDLKDRLRECISSSQQFAPYAFPQLLDKLDSTSPNVKKDVLQTITACASSYGLLTMSNYSVTLWDSIKFEILNVQEIEIEEEALKCLRAIAEGLDGGVATSEKSTHLTRYFKPILRECQEHLQEPTHKQAKPAGQILHVLGSVSQAAFYLITTHIGPPLMTMYQDAGDISTQRALLEVLVLLLDSAASVYGTSSGVAIHIAIDNPLLPFKDKLFELSSQALMSVAAEEVSFRIVALKILLQMSLLSNYLQSNEIGMFVQYLNSIMLGEDPNGREDLKREAIQALAMISRIRPNLIMDITLPAFMVRLPDSETPERGEYMVTLEALAQLGVEDTVANTVIRRLLSKLDTVSHGESSPYYSQAILSTIYHILGQRNLAEDKDLSFYCDKIVVSLTTRVASAALGKNPVTVLNEGLTLEIIGRLASKIIHALNQHQQRSIALQIYSLFAREDPFALSEQATALEKQTLIISTYFLAGIHSHVKPGALDSKEGNLQALLSQLVQMALVEKAGQVQMTVLKQIGLIANKFLPAEEIPAATNLLESIRRDAMTESLNLENAIKVIFWLAKALILRSSAMYEVLQGLQELLSIDATSPLAARGFSLLLAPDEILSKENGANIRLLSKQKIFTICVPSMAQAFRQAKPSVKSNYLIALSGILKYVPTEVVMPEIGNLLPLLLQSLDLADLDVKAATINTLTTVCQESSTVVEGHVGSMVARLLKSARDPQSNSANVRWRALNCLRAFPGKVKDSNLLPFRSSVTRNLLTALDDPKRDVRKAAVDCRAAWLALDEPQSE